MAGVIWRTHVSPVRSSSVFNSHQISLVLWLDCICEGENIDFKQGLQNSLLVATRSRIDAAAVVVIADAGKVRTLQCLFHGRISLMLATARFCCQMG